MFVYCIIVFTSLLKFQALEAFQKICFTFREDAIRPLGIGYRKL